MKCQNCKKTNSNSSNYCFYCGEELFHQKNIVKKSYKKITLEDLNINHIILLKKKELPKWIITQFGKLIMSLVWFYDVRQKLFGNMIEGENMDLFVMKLGYLIRETEEISVNEKIPYEKINIDIKRYKSKIKNNKDLIFLLAKKMIDNELSEAENIHNNCSIIPDKIVDNFFGLGFQSALEEIEEKVNYDVYTINNIREIYRIIERNFYHFGYWFRFFESLLKHKNTK